MISGKTKVEAEMLLAELRVDADNTKTLVLKKKTTNTPSQGT